MPHIERVTPMTSAMAVRNRVFRGISEFKAEKRGYKFVTDCASLQIRLISSACNTDTEEWIGEVI